MADITDGTSTTILFGESIYPVGDLVAGPDGLRPDQRFDRTINQPDRRQWHAELLDLLGKQASRPGELRLLRRDRPGVTAQINKIMLNKLMTRNGQETISSDEIK